MSSEFSFPNGSPYYSPLNPALYPQLAIILCTLGLIFASFFVVYEVSTTDSVTKKRNLVKELTLAGPASVFLGLGSLFLLLWTGVYV